MSLLWEAVEYYRKDNGKLRSDLAKAIAELQALQEGWRLKNPAAFVTGPSMLAQAVVPVGPLTGDPKSGLVHDDDDGDGWDEVESTDGSL